MPRKLHPAPMSLYYQIGDSTDTYIDLAKDLSNINRRFYRQGMNYAVAGFRFGYNRSSQSDSVNVAIQTLPTTWVVGAAWHKFFAAWQNQQNEALDAIDGENMKGRWNDFKIYWNSAHKAAGSLVPTTPGGFLLTPQTPHAEGEWNYSQIVTPVLESDDASGEKEFYLGMLGGDTTTVKGMIKHYGLSRYYPQSPDPVQGNAETSVLSQMNMVPSAAQSAAVINATDYNDDLPYDQNDYIGGDTASLGSNGYLHREITLIPTSTSNYKNVDGCLVPCGLLKISHDGSNIPAGSMVLQIILVPGTYKGYLAEPMQEMN